MILTLSIYFGEHCNLTLLCSSLQAVSPSIFAPWSYLGGAYSVPGEGAPPLVLGAWCTAGGLKESEIGVRHHLPPSLFLNLIDSV